MIQRKIYISGGISGYPLEEWRAVLARAEEELRSRGYAPVNPFNNGVSLDAPYEDHLRADLRMLLGCAGYLPVAWLDVEQGSMLGARCCCGLRYGGDR